MVQVYYVAGTSVIELKLCSYIANNIVRVKVGILLSTQLAANNIAVYEYGHSSGTSYPNALPVNFAVPFTTFGRPYYEMRCLFGLITFAIWIGTGAITLQFTFTGSGASAIGSIAYSSSVYSLYIPPVLLLAQKDSIFSYLILV